MFWLKDFILFLLRNKNKFQINYKDSANHEYIEDVSWLKQRLAALYMIVSPILIIGCILSVVWVLGERVESGTEISSLKESVKLLQEEFDSVSQENIALGKKNSRMKLELIDMIKSTRKSQLVQDPEKQKNKNPDEYFIVKKSQVKFKELNLSPFPIKIENGTIVKTGSKNFYVNVKLKNSSKNTVNGGLSGYISYVDHKNRLKKLYFPKDAKKIGQYITGPSRKFQVKNFLKYRMNFDFSDLKVKKIKSLYVNVRSQECFEADKLNKKCEIASAIKMATVYIEPQIEPVARLKNNIISKIFLQD